MSDARRCSRCGQVKPLEEFPRHRSQPEGRGYHCKPCHARVTRANIKKNHGSGRAFQLKRRYNVDAVQVQWMILQQGGTCAICKVRQPVHVDHDHDAERVRGILCFNCNRGLGKFGDDPALLRSAIAYIENARMDA
jgi:hypothetical protein